MHSFQHVWDLIQVATSSMKQLYICCRARHVDKVSFIKAWDCNVKIMGLGSLYALFPFIPEAGPFLKSVPNQPALRLVIYRQRQHNHYLCQSTLYASST